MASERPLQIQGYSIFKVFFVCLYITEGLQTRPKKCEYSTSQYEVRSFYLKRGCTRRPEFTLTQNPPLPKFHPNPDGTNPDFALTLN